MGRETPGGKRKIMQGGGKEGNGAKKNGTCSKGRLGWDKGERLLLGKERKKKEGEVVPIVDLSRGKGDRRVNYKGKVSWGQGKGSPSKKKKGRKKSQNMKTAREERSNRNTNSRSISPHRKGCQKPKMRRRKCIRPQSQFCQVVHDPCE